MKNITRLLSILLVCAMLFVGCGQTKTPSSTNSTASGNEGSSVTITTETNSEDVTTSTSTGATEQTSSTAGNTTTGSSVSNATTSKVSSTQNRPTQSFGPSNTSGRVKDLGGRVIRFQISPTEDKSSAAYKAQLKNIAAIEKQLNCKIEFVEMHAQDEANGNRIVTSILAGNPIVDIWMSGLSKEFYSHYNAGLMQNLTAMNVFDYENITWEPCMQAVTIGGKNYMIRPMNSENASWNSFILMFNNKLLNEYIPQYADKLYEWQKNGEWTWDKFEEVCKAFNKAAAADQTLTACFDRSGLVYSLLLATRGTDWIIADKKGNLSFNGLDKLAQEAMNQHTKYVKEGTIIFHDPQNVNDGWVASSVGNVEGTKYSFLSNQALFAFNIVGGYYWNVFQNSGTSQAVRDNVGVMLPPKMKASDKYTYALPLAIGGHCIPAGVKNPAEVATVMNLLLCEPIVSLTEAEKRKSYFSTLIEPTLNNKTSALTLHSLESSYDAMARGDYFLMLSSYGIITSTNIYGDKDSGWIGNYLYDIAQGTVAQSAAVATVRSKYNKILADLFK